MAEQDEDKTVGSTTSFAPPTYTPEQYVGSHVNFFNFGGLNTTGIQVRRDDEDDEDKKKDEMFTSVLSPVGSDDESLNPSVLAALSGNLGFRQYGVDQINYTDYATVSKSDKSDNFANKEAQSKFRNTDLKVAAGAGAAMSSGLLDPISAISSGIFVGDMVAAPFGKDSHRPGGPLGLALDLNFAQQAKNVAAIKEANGTGGMMAEINGMKVSRAPGRFIYTGNLSGMSQQQIKALEATKNGYLPQTYREDSDSDNPGQFVRGGLKGAIDAEIAMGMGGNYSQSGFFITSFGQGAIGTTEKNTRIAADFFNGKYGTDVLTHQDIYKATREAQRRAQAKYGYFHTVRDLNESDTFLDDVIEEIIENKGGYGDFAQSKGITAGLTDSTDPTFTPGSSPYASGTTRGPYYYGAAPGTRPGDFAQSKGITTGLTDEPQIMGGGLFFDGDFAQSAGITAGLTDGSQIMRGGLGRFRGDFAQSKGIRQGLTDDPQITQYGLAPGRFTPGSSPYPTGRTKAPRAQSTAASIVASITGRPLAVEYGSTWMDESFNPAPAPAAPPTEAAPPPAMPSEDSSPPPVQREREEDDGARQARESLSRSRRESRSPGRGVSAGRQSGSFDVSRSAGGSSGFRGARAQGGRVGMQAGGLAQRPVPEAGFVAGPPEQFTEQETVADDQNGQVAPNTFVINAAAVEYAGSNDIRKMILDAYATAREKGLDIGGVDRKLYEGAVDVALSKGEVVIPPELAKIIGYDRLEKINNRGKREVSRRQQAQQEKANGAFLGGLIDYMFGKGNDPVVTSPQDNKPTETESGFAERRDPPSQQYTPSTPLPKMNRQELLHEDLLSQVEENRSVAYIPKPKSGTHNSGVTVGLGFDIGQHKITELEKMGLNDQLLAKLTPYVNKRGKAAEDALEKDPLRLTFAELEELNTQTIRYKAERFKAKYPQYNDVDDPGHRSVLFSVYWFGAMPRYKTFKSEYKKHGNLPRALKKGVIDKISNKNHHEVTRAIKAADWYGNYKDRNFLNVPD